MTTFGSCIITYLCYPQKRSISKLEESGAVGELPVSLMEDTEPILTEPITPPPAAAISTLAGTPATRLSSSTSTSVSRLSDPKEEVAMDSEDVATSVEVQDGEERCGSESHGGYYIPMFLALKKNDFKARRD